MSTVCQGPACQACIKNQVVNHVLRTLTTSGILHHALVGAENSEARATNVTGAGLIHLKVRRRCGDSSSSERSIVIQDRANAAVLGEQGVAAQAEQVQVERLNGFPPTVPLDFNGDG